MKTVAALTAEGRTVPVKVALDVETLDPDDIPETITGGFAYEAGSEEDALIHSNEAKQLWLLGSSFEYEFTMESAQSNRFTAKIVRRAP